MLAAGTWSPPITIAPGNGPLPPRPWPQIGGKPVHAAIPHAARLDRPPDCGAARQKATAIAPGVRRTVAGVWVAGEPGTIASASGSSRSVSPRQPSCVGRRLRQGGVSAAPSASTEREPPRPGRAERLAEQVERVAERVEQPPVDQRRRDDLAQPCAERDQVAGQVAAVDGRDVARLGAGRACRCRTSLEVAAVALQPLQRVERLLEPVGQLAERQVAEVARRQRGEQVEPDVGRRGALGDDPARVLLEVVGRQQWSSAVAKVSKKRQVLRAVTAQQPPVASAEPLRARRGSAG